MDWQRYLLKIIKYNLCFGTGVLQNDHTRIRFIKPIDIRILQY